MRRLLLTAALLPPLALAGCGGDDDPETPPPDEPTPATSTWHADLKPIIDTRCNSCHVEGGPAPFTLDTVDAMRAMAPAALASIESGRMPPWMPDPDCRHYEHERLMPAAEVDVLRQWITDGMPEGDPADAPATEKAAELTFEPTHIAAPIEAYTPKAEITDDYRCFILDAEFDHDTFLTASRVVPDADALVHHVLVYAMSDDALETARTADANEDGPGYTCFGGPFPTQGSSGSTQAVARGGGLPTQLGAWVPGSVPAIYDEDLAVPIPAGSKIIMQVHYNLLAGPPVADATTFEMRLTDTPPIYDVASKPLVIHSLDIPAGEPYAENVRVYRNYSDAPVTFTGLAGHMHLLGTRLTAVIERDGGGDECLVDIPAWDFNWQQSYKLLERVTLQPGDAIRLTCAYDNSPQNQAVVDGVRREPVDVTWGEGTYDEMCMLYLTIIQPHQPPAELSCDGATACLEACEAEGKGASDCIMACPINTACKLCALRESANCGGIACASQLIGLRDEPCVENCVINTMMLGGDTSACLKDQCGALYDDLTTCLDPVVGGEACRAPLAETCGIVMPE